jgi:hypothetical protein
MQDVIGHRDEVARFAPSLTNQYGLLLLSSALAGQAITFANGAYSEPAVACVVAGLLVVTYSFFSSLRGKRNVPGGPHVLSLVWIALFAMLWTAISDPNIVIYAHRPWQLGRQAQWVAMGLLVSYLPWFAAGTVEPKIVSYCRFAAFAVLVVVVGIDTIHCSPLPRIDVWHLQMQGASLLLQGKNPFTYVAVHDTGPGTLGDAEPYVYPPTQVLATIPGWFLGDVRYTMLGAILVTGFVMRWMSERRQIPSLAKDAPSLFLFLTPKLFFVLEQSWVDPDQIMFISLALAAALSRRTMLTAVLFGIASTSKQTMFWLFPLAGFCLSFRLRSWILMGISAALPVVPFLLWDFKGMKYANFDCLNDLPFRTDALTINMWAYNNLHVTVPGAVGFLLAAAMVGLACWKLRGPVALASAIATTYYFFFAFNRWAFANYYFAISGLSALAAAAAGSVAVKSMVASPESAAVPRVFPSATSSSN